MIIKMVLGVTIWAWLNKGYIELKAKMGLLKITIKHYLKSRLMIRKNFINAGSI